MLHNIAQQVYILFVTKCKIFRELGGKENAVSDGLAVTKVAVIRHLFKRVGESMAKIQDLARPVVAAF